MRHNNLSVRVAVLSLLGLVVVHAKTTSAQQVLEVHSARISDRSPSAEIWDANNSQNVLTLKGHTNGVVSAAFFQDGERVLTGSGDCSTRVWDARTGAQLVRIDKTGFNRCYASVSGDGSRILTTNHPYVKLWDAKTGDVLLDLTHQVGLEQHWPFSFFGAFSPDGKQFTTCSPDFKLKLRDTKTGEELVTLKGHSYWPNCSAFSPDGSRVATGCQTIDDAARVWDAKTGTTLLVLSGHGGSVWSVSFAPDGQHLATGGADGKARLWDMKTGTELLTFTGHTKVVTAISFSPNGKRILTGSQDRTCRIWDTTTGAEIVVLKGHAESVTDAKFSPDGNRIVTASWDKTARIWDLQRFVEANSLDANGTTPPQPK